MTVAHHAAELGGYVTATAPRTDIAEEDRLRADLYDFLGALLARPPSAALLAQAVALEGDETPIGEGINALARVAKVTSEAAAEREFNALFIGLGRGELLPYASYYLTGFLNEKPLATLRADMAARRLSRAPNVYEPEDNIASLNEMMAAQITGRHGQPEPLERQREFFNRHIAPWAEHFYADLEAAKGSVLYASVGTIGRVFVDIEKHAFKLAG